MSGSRLAKQEGQESASLNTFAIAEAIVNIQAGLAKAANQQFPLNIAAMASVAAATAGIVSTISGTQYGGGRQYGGQTSAGSLYKINETGRPEMFTASNGSQYMLPTTSGQVTPADRVGGGDTYNQYFQVGAGITRGELLSTLQMFGEQLKGDILESSRNNGAFAR